MLDNTLRISIEGIEYPAMCNLRIMEQIQQKYGTTKKFIELLDPHKNEEPNIEAVIFALPKMIMAGMKAEKDERLFTIKKEEDIISRLGMNIFSLATLTIKIYAHAFTSKKE